MLPYACALRTGASYNYLLVNGYRRPSSRELLRLQGFPEKFEIVVSHSEIRRQTGNSVAVPMIREVAKRSLNYYEKNQGLETQNILKVPFTLLIIQEDIIIKIAGSIIYLYLHRQE